ncbi:MAG TPA: hypothetical protein VF677_06415 [Flavobacterium sp.]
MTTNLDNSTSAQIKKDTLFGDFDRDDNKDFLLREKSEGKLSVQIFLNKGNKMEKVESFTITPEFFSDEQYFKNADVYNKNNGVISITGFCCGNFKTIETHFYNYNQEAKTWILDKICQHIISYGPISEYELEYPTKAISISGKVLNNIIPQSNAQRKISAEKLLSESLYKFTKMEIKAIANVTVKEDFYTFLELIKLVPISKENVGKYNDLGYYLQQTKTEDGKAQLILEEVVKKFPDRTVAYINLADSYWDVKSYDEAKTSYNKYIDLMKKSGKEAKIPKKVLERVK